MSGREACGRRHSVRAQCQDAIDAELLTSSVGSAVYCSIVDADQMPVFSLLYIEFKSEPQFKTGSGVGESVFRSMKQKATVSDN